MTVPWVRRARLVAAVIAVAAAGPALGAQGSGPALADRPPRFYAIVGPGGERVDASSAPVLARRISLDLTDVPVAAALDSIGARSGLRFAHGSQVIPGGLRVTVHATDLTIAAALTETLFGLGVDVELSPSGLASLVRRSRQGTVTGRVTDAETGGPLANALVGIEGGGARDVSNDAGRFTLRDVPAGRHVLFVRRLGYVSRVDSVTVSEGSTLPLDIALRRSPALLDQVVVTGAGTERRVESGNAIATIAADSIVPTAVIASVTDLLSGQAANVDVIQSSGAVGAGPRIRIRGLASIETANDPIIYIDGVRADNSPGAINDPSVQPNGFHPTSNRLDDLAPEDIESIEVLRGPSAATEYGTDAANGVIVVKTKQGHAGPPRWEIHAEDGISTIPERYPEVYRSWGHTTDGNNTPVTCPLIGGGPYASPVGSATGGCAVDSVTQYQPLDHASTTLFGDGHLSNAGVQVSGGSAALRYFLAANASGEVGVLKMPQSEVSLLEGEGDGPLPYNELRPNTAQRANVRARTDASIGDNADVSVTASYLSSYTTSPDEFFALNGAYYGAGYRDSTGGYSGLYALTPAQSFANTGSEDVGRFVGGLTAHWRAAPWLTFRATGGLDDETRTDESLTLPGAQTFDVKDGLGYRNDGLYRTGIYTVDLAATAVVPLGPRLSGTTVLGAQYVETRTHGNSVTVTDLGLGDPTLNNGTPIEIHEYRVAAATLGSFLDETIGWADRLFVTGAVRIDDGSGFGSSYTSAVYPKASVSWVLSREPSNLLRLRAAYGQSGVQPRPGAALRLYAPWQVPLNGGVVPGDTLAQYGNANLKPERTGEFEGGVDAGVWHNRVTIELTGYTKTSQDALIDVPVEGSLGAGTIEENLGSVLNRGVELAVTGQLLDGPTAAWTVTVSGSVNQNRLLSLGPGVSPITDGSQRQVVGYPIYGYWSSTFTYADLNHDGIIEPNEVTLDTTARFVGSSVPTRQVSLNTSLFLFHRLVRIGAQVDYRGGFYQFNLAQLTADAVESTQATNDPHAPLYDQARAVAQAGGSVTFPPGYVEAADFVRWRELSVTLAAPDRWAARAKLRALAVTLGVRNLALWTRYPGVDPEVGGNRNADGSSVALPGTAVNRDAVADFGIVPQPRTWLINVNVGL